MQNIFKKFAQNLDTQLADFQEETGFAPDFLLYLSFEWEIIPNDKSWTGVAPYSWGIFKVNFYNFDFEYVFTADCVIEDDDTVKPRSTPPRTMPASLAKEFPEFIAAFAKKYLLIEK